MTTEIIKYGKGHNIMINGTIVMWLTGSKKGAEKELKKLLKDDESMSELFEQLKELDPKIRIMKPSNYVGYPWSSILQKSECETIAQNIMIILKRTGNKFRDLPWSEYASERKKDGNFTESEKQYFDKVIDFCKSGDTAKLFCSGWKADD